MRVLQLIPKMHAGGAEMCTLDIVEALADAGHKAMVGSAPGPWTERIDRRGGQAFPMDFRKSLLSLRNLSRLQRLVRQQQPDIVHVRSRVPAWHWQWVASRLGETARPRTVTTLHGLNSVSRYSAVMLRADRVIAVSAATKRYWQQHYPKQAASMIVIARGVDAPAAVPSVRAARQRLTTAFGFTAKPVLVSIGRLNRRKGHAQVLKLAQRSGSQVLIVGPGTESARTALRNRAHDLGVFTVIDEPRKDIDWILQGSTALCCLGAAESYGRVAAQALVLGKPVIAWDHGGIGDNVRRCFPVGAVTPGDLDAALHALQAIVRRPQPVDRSGIESRGKMQAATLATYEQVLAR